MPGLPPAGVGAPEAGRKLAAAGRGRGGDDPGPWAALSVPHGKQPAELHDILSDLASRAGAPPADPTPRPRRMPGPRAAEARQDRDAVAEYVLQAERILFEDKQTCQECHEYFPPNPGALRAGRAPDFTIAAPRVPDVWLTQAFFNHKSHLPPVADCRRCHPGPTPERDGTDNPTATATSEAVMLPGIKTCRQCHAPAGPVARSGGVAARHDCVECHNYHDREPSGAGPGHPGAGRARRGARGASTSMARGGPGPGPGRGADGRAVNPRRRLSRLAPAQRWFYDRSYGCGGGAPALASARVPQSG
jgi:hypothetical protein